MHRVGIISFLFVFLSAFFSFQLPSPAQDFGPTYKKQYIGLAGGVRNFKISGIDGINDDFIDYDETDFAYKVYSGRKFTRNFGIEFSVVDYGKSEGSLIDANNVSDTLEVEGWGATIHAVGYLTQSDLSDPDSEYVDHMELFGKIGPAWVDQTVSGQVTDNQGNTAT